jgi:RimJ/RimL family protein N-acetyltransferase
MEAEKVFENCPVYQSEHFLFRKMKMEDAERLFQCYSNRQAARYFNGDCCNDDFYYTDFNKFMDCMKYWESRYQAKDFVRFTIVDRDHGNIIGMAEVCPSYKYSADGLCMGILRIDNLPEYETESSMQEMMTLIINHVYKDFGVKSILMKAQDYAEVRRKVLKQLQFVPAQDECNISFNDYFIRY